MRVLSEQERACLVIEPQIYVKLLQTKGKEELVSKVATTLEEA